MTPSLVTSFCKLFSRACLSIVTSYPYLELYIATLTHVLYLTPCALHITLSISEPCLSDLSAHLCAPQAAQRSCANCRWETRCWRWAGTGWQRWATASGRAAQSRPCSRAASPWTYVATAGTVSRRLERESVRACVCVRANVCVWLFEARREFVFLVSVLFLFVMLVNYCDTLNWSVNCCAQLFHGSLIIISLSQ